jgi:hypothetical protein
MKGIVVGNAQTGKQAAGAAKKSSGPVVGGHVEASCRKCKEITTHIVLAMVSGKPSKVECRVCHGTHAYKATATTPRASASPRAASSRASRAPEPSPADVWASSMRQARGEAVAYAPSGRYAVGARLKHSSFGEGVVARLASMTVCEVVFVTGTVKLIMGATAQGRKPGN